ncbi:MAG: metallo-beta-lactamase [Paenibacillus sp.]|nr:metallo-beta-lactamase [Paenibacillus sp.]
MMQPWGQHAAAPYSADEGYCRIQAIDLNSAEHTKLGQPPTLPADSFLVSYIKRDRQFHMLVDAGKKGQGEHIVIPALRAHGINRIDLLFISHMHRDHYGGVIDLLTDGTIEIGRILVAPIPEEVIRTGNATGYETWKELDRLLADHASITRILGEDDVGARIGVDDELFWTVIAVPDRDSFGTFGINDLNVVLKLHYRGFTALFPGDCGGPQAEQVLQSSQREAIRDVFFVKAAHHGKGESLSKEMIELCNAQMAVITSNPYVAEHQRAKLMEHVYDYGANGAKVYRADRCRRIELITDGNTVHSFADTRLYSEQTMYRLGR